MAEHNKERLNADGGWSQTKNMASNAWATGQAGFPDPAVPPRGLCATEQTRQNEERDALHFLPLRQ
jgi:hypothetical protein